MQASTSHAVLGQAVRSFAASKLLPPCTCRARLFSSLDTPSGAAVDVPEGLAENTLRFANTKPRRVRNIPTHADRLAAREEKKSTVFLDGLSPWVTPNDVRRLLEQRLVPLRNVVEVVMLPRADLQPSGRAVVQFANYRKASEAVDALRGKTSPGIVEDYLEARTVYMDKPPYAEMLNQRAPLATRAAAYLAYNSEGAPNLKAGLGFSGRAVMLSGFPATIPPSAILERLHKEDFYPMAGPGMSMDGPLMQEIVHLKSRIQNRDTKFLNYLVRLPNKADAHRLAASWNATYPKGAMMNAEVRISAKVVW